MSESENQGLTAEEVQDKFCDAANKLFEVEQELEKSWPEGVSASNASQWESLQQNFVEKLQLDRDALEAQISSANFQRDNYRKLAELRQEKAEAYESREKQRPLATSSAQQEEHSKMLRDLLLAHPSLLKEVKDLGVPEEAVRSLSEQHDKVLGQLQQLKEGFNELKLHDSEYVKRHVIHYLRMRENDLRRRYKEYEADIERSITAQDASMDKKLDTLLDDVKKVKENLSILGLTPSGQVEKIRELQDTIARKDQEIASLKHKSQRQTHTIANLKSAADEPSHHRPPKIDQGKRKSLAAVSENLTLSQDESGSASEGRPIWRLPPLAQESSQSRFRRETERRLKRRQEEALLRSEGIRPTKRLSSMPLMYPRTDESSSN